MANKVIDPAPIIKDLADWCLKAKGLECSVLGSVIDMLKAAPRVDTVKVVRCKDCRLWIRNGGFTNGPTGHCFCHDIVTTAHDFCSYGERRDNNATG